MFILIVSVVVFALILLIVRHAKWDVNIFFAHDVPICHIKHPRHLELASPPPSDFTFKGKGLVGKWGSLRDSLFTINLKPGLDEKRIGEEIEKTPEALINVVCVRSSKLLHELATMMFSKLGIAGYPNSNGILLLINLTSFEFALLFDHELRTRLSNNLLDGIRDRLVSDFKRGNYTEGICRLIQSCRERSNSG